jgi:hypothetical protein
MFDFDNNGCQDLFFANATFRSPGVTSGAPSPLPNSIFRNKGAGRFEMLSRSERWRSRLWQISTTMEELMSW